MEEITTESAIIIQYLPEDVLRQIFSHLDHIDLNSTSLVCRRFCSHSSPLVHEVTLKDSFLTYSHFQRLFKRFSGVNEICIDNFSYLDNVLSAISNSGLNLEKLHLRLIHGGMNAALYPALQTIEKMSTSRVIKGIKSLQLNLFDAPKEQTVVEFVNMLPSLTELDSSCCYFQWDDEGIHKVTSKLPNLKKINLTLNRRLTDKTLDILSSNCPKLESVNFEECMKFTSEALYKFCCNNPQLSSVDMPPSISKVVECVQVLRNLNRLSLDTNHLEDAVLIGLAESRPSLKSLVICNAFDSNYTITGLCQLLAACPGLESLNISLPHHQKCNTHVPPKNQKKKKTGLCQLLAACPGLESLNISLPHHQKCNTHDTELSIVVKRLPILKHITVWSCFVCQATLFSLVQNCPLLETISLQRYSCIWRVEEQVYCDQGMTIPTKKNHRIKSIKIDPKSDIWLLSAIESYCPNLRK